MKKDLLCAGLFLLQLSISSYTYCREDRIKFQSASLALRHFRGLLRGFRLFNDFSVKEVDSPLGMLGETCVVGNHADGRAFAMQALQQLHYGFAIPGIQVSGWLVRQQDRW